MSFITKSNSFRIISKINLKEAPEISEDVYDKPIYFLNSLEKKTLIHFKNFLKSPSNFIKDYYKPIEVRDNFMYVYEGGRPSYHLTRDCSKLKSDYKNYAIPKQIRDMGNEKIKEFRKWFKSNIYLIDKPNDVFQMRIQNRFGIKISLSELNHENSGVIKINNLNLNELENKINSYLFESAQYFKKASQEKKDIIRKYQKHTYLAYNNKEFENKTRFSDDVIRRFLMEYDKNFKLPTKELLKEYYRVKYNPQLKFEGDLLEQLGFKLCNVCSKNNFEDNFDSFLNIIDELK